MYYAFLKVVNGSLACFVTSYNNGEIYKVRKSFIFFILFPQNSRYKCMHYMIYTHTHKHICTLHVCMCTMSIAGALEEKREISWNWS